MLKVNSKTDTAWLEKTLVALQVDGCAIITNVLDGAFLEKTREALYNVQKRVHKELGVSRLQKAGELGVFRLMMKYNAHFFSFLEISEVLSLVDSTVSKTAVLHLQNGFILPSLAKENTPEVFQNKYHRDVKRILNGYIASINIFFAIDEFTQDNGARFTSARTSA